MGYARYEKVDSPEAIFNALTKEMKEYVTKILQTKDLVIVRGNLTSRFDKINVETAEMNGFDKEKFHIPGTTYYVSRFRLADKSAVARVVLMKENEEVDRYFFAVRRGSVIPSVSIIG